MNTNIPEDEFREPLLEDEEGLYVTVAQMNFFLNRKDGKKKFKAAHPDFLSYYNHCRLYNMIYDMMDKDPKCATLYWDEKKEAISLSFPIKGKVAEAVSFIAKIFAEEDEGTNLFD
jgi:hypothetical protein